ncbi:E3 ubiquitin-protein ligase ZNF598-like [Uloborus diversus]|uniref:E3 ubiquitin-protein ligase ZNF598-like n=1 Tax=Uloborus diversus TaxID=327109 RepID=UPI0024094F5A|nr:E3 ubiquitin-protein ligase ZNF598-like [Uloborus diversus]
MKSDDLEECVLCCRDIKIFATGLCDHPVCYECSTRMRVLCETNECPICRTNMPMVIFTHVKQPYLDVSEKFSLRNEKYQVTFQDGIIQHAFEVLLENRCNICAELLISFQKLKEHMRRTHELHYCDLCTDNLKIFSFERTAYSRKDLALHKRGDPNNPSNRGHPLCGFCDERYVDADDLFRHLRREHYFCHFCDADGSDEFFKDYDFLRVHFRKEHYLCEEGECAREKFVGAFRTEIDLKAHIAQKHFKNKSKAEVRQARTLDFEFTYAHANRPSGNSSPRGGRRYGQHRKRNIDENNSRDSQNQQQAEVENIDTGSTQEFPYLSEDATPKTNHVMNPVSKTNPISLQTFSRNPTPYRRKDITLEEDFPALCSTNVAATSDISNNQSKNFSSSRQNAPARPPNVQKNISSLSAAERLSQNSVSNSVNVAESQQKPKWIPKRENAKFEDEFPRLQIRKPEAQSNVNNINMNSVPPPRAFHDVNHTSSNSTASNPPPGDQFVTIKSKSKKKKQKAPAWTNREDDEDDFGQDRSSDMQLSYLRTKNALLLNDQENTDPYKKNLIRPVSPSRVDENPWVEKVSFAKDDFPPLAPSEPVRQPPGFSAPKKKTPPPGFTPTAQPTPKPVKMSLSSIARQIALPDQDKTELASNSYDLKETYRTYMKPPDFETRNEQLIKRIYELSLGSEHLFNDFKAISGKFRQNRIDAAEYHSKCLQVLGEEGFLEIFPDLVSLLPDIGKQQELFAVHNSSLSKKHGGAVPKKLNGSSSVYVCDICQQVVMLRDNKSHGLAHKIESLQ